MTPNALVILQRIDDDNNWIRVGSFHAEVNLASGKEYVAGRTEQSFNAIIVKLRYSPTLANIYLNTASYRIKCKGYVFDIKNYDDFKFKHRNITLYCEGIGHED